MKSLFVLYCDVDDPIHFEEAIKDRKWLEAMDEEINAIEKKIHGNWLISQKVKK